MQSLTPFIRSALAEVAQGVAAPHVQQPWPQRMVSSSGAIPAAKARCCAQHSPHGAVGHKEPLIKSSPSDPAPSPGHAVEEIVPAGA